MSSTTWQRKLRRFALQVLPRDVREAFRQFAGDLTLREIAAATRESVTTVEGRVYRGLRRLREEMDATDGG